MHRRCMFHSTNSMRIPRRIFFEQLFVRKAHNNEVYKLQHHLLDWNCLHWEKKKGKLTYILIFLYSRTLCSNSETRIFLILSFISFFSVYLYEGLFNEKYDQASKLKMMNLLKYLNTTDATSLIHTIRWWFEKHYLN